MNVQVWDTMGNYGASPYIWLYRTGASVASTSQADEPSGGPGRGVGPPAPRPNERPEARQEPVAEPSPSKPAE